ncbi:MAG TPA: SAM-dependent methyltransferase [Streptosporangiaceae bacterium]
MSESPRDTPFRPVDPERLGVASGHAEVDPAKPSPARMYDYYLGGKDNFESDRVAAEEIYTQIPDLPEIARDNRGMMQRAVRYLAAKGITQFVDIGAGLPTQGNVHEIAQGVNPAARIVYADNDPIVLAHARALLTSSAEGETRYLDADLRDPESIFENPVLHEIIDLEKPVGLILVAVLHFITEDADPYDLLARYRAYLPKGSYVVLAHASRQDMPEAAWRKMEAVYARSSAPFVFRDRTQVTRLFDGMELVEPGLVYCPEWRPEPGTPRSRSAAWNFGGVGYVG